MNSFTLKLIAIITMTIDHVGAVLFPQYYILRVIGRVSFPIFAFLIANGYHYTKDVKKYSLRLLAFGFIAQYPFAKAFSTTGLNIFFTLFLGLLAMIVFDRIQNKPSKYLIIVALAYLATYLDTDYGWFGVILILLFHVFRDNFKKLSISIIALNLVSSSVIAYVVFQRYNQFNIRTFVECVSILSLVFIVKYNNEKGRSMKYLFYIYYPLHLLILYFINTTIM